MNKYLSILLSVILVGFIYWLMILPPSFFNQMQEMLFEKTFIHNIISNEDRFIFIMNVLICSIIGLVAYEYLRKTDL